MPTISDVARRAQVSAATVSRVIQGAANVHPATRERVERAIADLGYVPSAVAQSLRSRRSHSLALVVPDITNTFWTTVARGVEDVAQEHDYSVFLGNTDEDPAKQRRYLDFLVSQQVDGVLLAPHDSDARHLEKLRQRNIPTVILDRRVDGWEVDSVYCDSISGARALVQHLISLGHRRIGCIAGPPTTSTAEDRVAGYCMALAEAGIPVDARLIRRGEYRDRSGEEMALRLLDEGPAPTALFAANNALAMGIIDALEKRGLRIPQDLALVCFDDLHYISHFFPFLTVVAQPVYDLGVNAAQLLFSRLESKGSLQPRHVVLPTRLIVRHSCGSQLAKTGECPLSLPISHNGLQEARLVRPVSPEERRDLSLSMRAMAVSLVPGVEPSTEHDRPNVRRLLVALRHAEADRLPHLELDVTSRAVFEYVLERPLHSAGADEPLVTPDDHVEFALRLGLDAVPCNLVWPLLRAAADVGELAPPPSIVQQLNTLERYLRATQGTSVGVIVNVGPFLGAALHLGGGTDQLPACERLLDQILEYQERLLQVVCDRFADDVAVVMLSDDLADEQGPLLSAELMAEMLLPRLRRLVRPVQEHEKLLLLNSRGKMADLLPVLHATGFHGIYPVEPACNDIAQLKKEWAGRMALVGNISTTLLASGSRDEIETHVHAACLELAPGGGYVLGPAGPVDDSVPPANLVTMARAVHRYGRYGAPGREAWVRPPPAVAAQLPEQGERHGS